jgi:hypothetical protein
MFTQLYSSRHDSEMLLEQTLHPKEKDIIARNAGFPEKGH